MRMNNRSARLTVNKWLLESGLKPIDASASYTDFATELRRQTTKTVSLVPFAWRPDATHYVRQFAKSIST